MLKRLVFVLVIVPIALVLLALAVANRQDVSLNWNPFTPDFPGHQIVAPFFWFLFATFALGLLVGGIAAWFGQSRYRREARTRGMEAEEWRYKADRERERAEAMAEKLVKDVDDGHRYPTQPRQRPLALLGQPR